MPRYRPQPTYADHLKFSAVLVALLILLSLACKAQDKKTYTLTDMGMAVDSLTGAMSYTDVVPVPGASADELYSRAKSAVVKLFTNESAVTQTDDRVAGVITARGKLVQTLSTGTMLLTGVNQMYYEVALEIRVKDERYRYEFSDMEIVTPRMRMKIDDQMRKNPRQAEKARAKQYSQKEYDKYMSEKNPIQAVIRQLKQAMGNPSAKKADF